MSVSINHLVTIILLVLLIPASILVIHSGTHERENQKKYIEDKLWQITDFVAANQHDLTTSVEQIEHLLFHLITDGSALDDETIQPVLANIMDNNHLVENIFIADSSGKVVVAADSNSKPDSIADHRSFVNGKKTKKPASGECDSTMKPGSSAICFGFPLLTKQGDFRGLILIRYKIKLYENILKKADYRACQSDCVNDFSVF